MLPLVRPGRAAAPLRRLCRRILLLSSSPQTPSPSSSSTPYSSKISPLLLLLSPRPSPLRRRLLRRPGLGRRLAMARRELLRRLRGRRWGLGGLLQLLRPLIAVPLRPHRCRKEDAEVLSEGLLCFGATSVTVDDIAAAGNLDEITITSIYAHGEDVDSSVSSAASSAGLEYKPVYETSVGKQCDWVTVVQETYESTKVIDGLWVIPKWRTPPETVKRG